MKRLVCIFLSCLLLTTAFPIAYARDATPLIEESFETGILGKLTAHEAYIRVTTEQGASGSGNSLAVKMNAEYGGLRSPVDFEVGMRYRISAWIKLVNAPQAGRVSFAFRGKAIDGEEMLYYTAAVSQAGLAVAGNWSYVETEFLFNGYGARTIGGAHNLKMSSEVIMQMVVGNGEVNEYYVDELCLRPLATTANIVRGGGFDRLKDLQEWQQDRCTAYIAEGGADSSPGCVLIQETAKYGQLRQNIAVKYNRTYTVSFWAKTDDASFAGLPIALYFDRKSVKEDVNVADYQKLEDSLNKTLTMNWIRYTTTYRYAIDTFDACRPVMYLRVGDGDQRVRMYLDGFEIREIASDDITLTGELSGGAVTGNKMRLSFLASPYRKNINYRYRIYRTSDEGEALVTEGSCENSKAEYTLSPKDKGTRLVFEVLAVDSYGDCVGRLSKMTETVAGGSTADFDLISSEWEEDDETIAVRVRLKSDSQESAFACVALYNKDGALRAVNGKNVTAGEPADLFCRIPQDAAYSKLFAWNGELSPYTEYRQIDKRVSQLSFYIDAKKGLDSNEGSYNAPFATVAKATEAACAVKDTDIDRINLIFKEGLYSLTETVSIGSRGSSAPEICYRAEQGGNVAFSGGRRVEGWSLHDEQKGIYKAFVGTGVLSRQLYINDVRAERARSEGGLSACTVDETGHTSSDTFLADFVKPQDLELVYFKGWVNQRCGVESISKSGGVVQLTMSQPVWQRLRDGSSTAVDYPSYYENAYELLDEEGEWYLDSDSGYLYYKPRFFENITEAEIVLPVLETLMRVEGSNENEPAQRVIFDGISFKHNTWNKVTLDNGLYVSQNNYLRYAQNRLSTAAVEVKNAMEITFKNCEFSKVGSIALKLWGAIRSCRVQGNEFSDISSNAIALGEPNYTDKNIYIPTDYKYMIIDNKITDNYIHHIGMDYSSASAISAGFPKNTDICNNEIFAVPYSGIHVGFGWAEIERSGLVNVRINNNCITDVLNREVYDGGGIYVLGATGGTGDNPNEICGNYIRDVRNPYGALYPDMGSSYWLFEKNVVDFSGVDKWVRPTNIMPRWFHAHHPSINHLTIRNNYSTTADVYFKAVESSYEAPTVCQSNAWPAAAQAIINGAGISQEYSGNFTEKLYKINETVSISAMAGGQFTVKLDAKTTKNMGYDTASCNIYYKVLTPDIISMTNTPLTGRALKNGTGRVDIYVVENGIMRICEATINVR